MCKKCIMLDDIVYFGTLAMSIILGSYYKNINNVDIKKHYGTGVGMLVTFLICGQYLYHTILMVWLNAVIIKYCDKRYVHIASLTYTWLHLFYIHMYLSFAKYIIIVHQTIALRLVGLAFEVYSAYNGENKTNYGVNDNSESSIREIEPVDVISYAFCFIGLHKGPYYRYKMYAEHLKGTFGSLGNFRLITEHKLKKVLICMVAYALLCMKYTNQIYNDNSFYSCDMEARYLYNVPILMMFVLKEVAQMMLCACVCTEAGFGVYPARTEPIPGHGPSVRLSLLNLPHDEAIKQEFNFTMIKCYNKEKILIGPKIVDTVRSWNMPVRYWFLAHINKHLSNASKELRSAVSFLVWSVWRGTTVGTVIISSTVWAHIQLEAEYSELYNTTGRQMKIAWDIGFSIMRMFCLIYLTPCFVLNHAPTILKYYNSMFWVFHAILLVLFVGAIVANRSRYSYRVRFQSTSSVE